MTTLPDGWSTRRPTLDDVPAILALVHASDMAAIGEADFTAAEVREVFDEPHTDMARDSWLALDPGGEVVGWAFQHNPSGGDRDFAEVYVWPGRGLPAQRPLLALLMARMAERAAELGHDSFTVRAGAVPTEKPYIEALTDAGFTFVKRNARMRMSLDGVPATPPEPPAGATIRPLRAGDQDELRRFHAVITEAFRDTDHTGVDFDTWWRQVDSASMTHWDEWFVAEVDGEMAGVLQSYTSDEPDEGWVKRLAVLRAYRKRGLGEALLRRAFAAYVANGRTTAGLGVDMENPTRAIRLYLAVGLTPLYETDIFELKIL